MWKLLRKTLKWRLYVFKSLLVKWSSYSVCLGQNAIKADMRNGLKLKWRHKSAVEFEWNDSVKFDTDVSYTLR